MAPTQVVRRKLRIGILPATVPRVTDARALRAAGRHPFDGKSLRQRVTATERSKGHVAFILTPRLASEDRQVPVVLTSLKPETATKSIPGTDQSQPKTLGPSFPLRKPPMR